MIGKILKKLRQYKSKFFKATLAKICYRSTFLSTLYYLFDSGFARENKAVLAGIVKHLSDAKQLQANYFLLVRNTHRIEKGLLMRPKRAVFAKDYIKETIDSLTGVWDITAHNSNPQLKWFYDVLSEYFISASVDPFVATQYERFKTITSASTEMFKKDVPKSVPYYRQDHDKSSISYEEFYKLTKQRRSVRWFLNKPVPRDLIDKALLAASQSPSACNRQPFTFRIIDDPELVKKAVTLPMGTAGYGQSIPVFVVLVGNLDAYFEERDRHVIYIDASLASMSFMFALETLGLSSCAINWPDIEEREQKMSNFLKLERHQRPIMCIGIGYADPEGMVAFSEKRSLQDFSKYNL
ncbi:nitroreductase family protein [Mucilaginibacter litoreus]|uniref:Nitroreductase family protein n=1 Tax=Mucilaginibacter litoreus TaxID=1048221 RepID=A0ABW3AVQ2_9SPHI